MHPMHQTLPCRTGKTEDTECSRALWTPAASRAMRSTSRTMPTRVCNRTYKQSPTLMLTMTPYRYGTSFLTVVVLLHLSSLTYETVAIGLVLPDSSRRLPVTAINCAANGSLNCSPPNMDETSCSWSGVCELRCPTDSRSDFPKAQFPLTAEAGWTKEVLSSQCQINSRMHNFSPPVSGSANFSNGWLLVNNTNVRCVVSSNNSLPTTSGRLALTMWFYPNCNANCTLVHVYLGNTTSPAWKVYLNNKSLCLNNFCDNATYSDWTHLVLQVQGGKVAIALDGVFRVIPNLSSLNISNLSPLNITVGLSEPYNAAEEYKLVDVRYYNDVLTHREIQQIFSGKPLQEAGLLSSCRCPSAHLILNSDNYTCQSENGKNISRLTKIFHNTSAIVDVNDTTKWSGPDNKPFDLEVTLIYEYQVEAIEIQVASNISGAQIEVNLTKGSSSRFLCNSSFCSINLTLNTSTMTPALFASHVTKTLTLHVQNSSRPLIISSIVVYGRCNCNGKAGSCNITEKSYKCICQSSSNTEGTHCELCKSGFYSNNTSPAIGFDTCEPCGCNANGIIASNTSCNTTGKCSCKSHIQGRTCDECEDGYYNFKQGCLPCNCSIGSLSVTCNKTSGQCQCQGGILTDRACSPRIDHMTPNFGPLAGKTRVSVFGQLLGNNRAQILIDNRQQLIVERNWTVIVFETEPSNIITDVKVIMQWTGTNESFVIGNFSYRSNPQLVTNALVSGIKTFKSGGCTVRIQGSNFDSVAFPLFVINDISAQSANATGSCRTIQQDLLCTTPPLHSALATASHRFGLRLDGFTGYSDLGPAQVHEDPKFHDISGSEVQLPFESTVKLTGSGFQQGCSQDDIHVLLGVVSCDIVKVTDTEIECKPPHNIQGASDVAVTVKFGSVIVNQIGTIDFPHFSKSRYFIGIMCGIGGLILLIIVIIIIIKCRHRSNAKPSRGDSDLVLVEKPAETVERNDNINLNRGSIEATPNDYQPFAGIINAVFLDTPIRAESVIREPRRVLPPTEKEVDLLNNLLMRVESSLCDSIRSAVVSASDLTQGRVCTNKGKYARIINGQFATTTAGQRLEQKVTIKTLINPLPAEGLYPAWVNAALREVLRLHQHTDDNVLSIIGIALAPDRFHVVYPYMEHRTLKDNIMDIKKEFSVHHLLEFGLQVADGLAYLHVNGIVHRDLATRNCMLNHMDVVKISDAAFAWDFYSEEYLYDSDRERYLPLRWLAPESLKDGYYSSHSDMWSFGVLLWELLTRAVCLPFHEMADNQVKDYVLAGYMLGKPENCPHHLYELMKGCWSQEIEHRPKSEEGVKQLENILTDGGEGQGDVYANLMTEGYYENQAALGKTSTKRKAPSPPK